jgi:hypothetical protein
MEALFYIWSTFKLYKDDTNQRGTNAHVEVGYNTSTITLRVVGGERKGTQLPGYNWAILFLWDINTKT